MSGEPAPRFDPNRRRAVTLSLLLVSALASFESTVVSTAMPTIIGDLGRLPFAIGVFLSGAIACAFARSMPQLIGARALQGLGAAGLVPIAMTVAADLHSLEQHALVHALVS